MDQYKNYIAGEWSSGEGTTENINPSDTNDCIGLYAQATENHTNDAIEAASRAFPDWSRSGVQ